MHTTVFLYSKLGSARGHREQVCTVGEQAERKSEVLLVMISLCCVPLSRQGDQSEVRGCGVESCVCVFLSCLCLEHICVSVCVCVRACVWRISVLLQSSGCNQTGHWLHDVPKTSITTHCGSASMPFTLSCMFGCWSWDLGGMLGVKTIILAHITVSFSKTLCPLH